MEDEEEVRFGEEEEEGESKRDPELSKGEECKSEETDLSPEVSPCREWGPISHGWRVCLIPSVTDPVPCLGPPSSVSVPSSFVVGSSVVRESDGIPFSFRHGKA